MSNPLIQQQIVTELQQLNERQQQQVLDFARFLALKKPIDVLGQELLRFAGTISKDDLEQMSKVIKEECEKIDENEW